MFKEHKRGSCTSLLQLFGPTYSAIPSATQEYHLAFYLTFIYYTVSPAKSPTKLHHMKFFGECGPFCLLITTFVWRMHSFPNVAFAHHPLKK